MKIRSPLLTLLILLAALCFCSSSKLTEDQAKEILIHAIPGVSVEIEGIRQENTSYVVKAAILKNKKPKKVLFKFLKYDTGWQIDEFQTVDGIWLSFSVFLDTLKSKKEIEKEPEEELTKAKAEDILLNSIPGAEIEIQEMEQQDDSYLTYVYIEINDIPRNISFKFIKVDSDWQIGSFMDSDGQWVPFDNFQADFTKTEKSEKNPGLTSGQAETLIYNSVPNEEIEFEGVRQEGSHYIVRANISVERYGQVIFFKVNKYENGWLIDEFRIFRMWFPFNRYVNFTKRIRIALVEQAMENIKKIGQGIEMYRLQYNHPPKVSSLEKLEKILKPFIPNIFNQDFYIVDPWNNRLIYRWWKIQGLNIISYSIRSRGPDRKVNTKDDILFVNGKFEKTPKLD